MFNRRQAAGITVAAFVALSVGSFVSAAHAQEKVTVFAAASLKNALDSINAAWKGSSGRQATISYAASSALAKQIEAGAPADVFVSADLDWMNYLANKKLIKTGTEVRLLANRIVLVAPADSWVTADIKKGFDLAGLLKGGKLAMGNVEAVPAGKYGKDALEHLGVWQSVSGDVAQAENVRAALALVATGEAPLGIVYETDAVAEKKVKVVGVFPEDSHEPIIYPAAETAEASSADADAFLDYLKTAEARTLFEAQGFTVLPAAVR
ncbi:molybdate ABC transporter substrate-binding protein [Tianweitania sp. BSSL-BM11]|uniref:Molybdate ABC transporter substrate-binding protein n=1 Tax=Tianweitania aestuarii TaxID=2814886 RepID=A0ABS5RW32_9HYPH|nr:molybdate ABC transporter substrate-binding protein [Tianweitania aestuarii]MBS9721285.1 molybdate ABC transporter substrate-binding protein [Tianweitania aestuarii]